MKEVFIMLDWILVFNEKGTVLRLERRVEIGIRLQLPKPNAVFKGKYVSSLIIYGRYATTIFQREQWTMLQKLYKSIFVTMFPACVLRWKSSWVAKRIEPFNTRSV